MGRLWDYSAIGRLIRLIQLEGNIEYFDVFAIFVCRLNFNGSNNYLLFRFSKFSSQREVVALLWGTLGSSSCSCELDKVSLYRAEEVRKG
jgi:hypothetical protein